MYETNNCMKRTSAYLCILAFYGRGNTENFQLDFLMQPVYSRYSFVGSLQLGIPYTYTMLAVTRKMPDAKKKMRVAVKVSGRQF